MPAPLTITALDLAEWADRLSARSLLPVLVRRLVQEVGIALSATDFPGYDEAQRPGWDGWTEAVGVSSWVSGALRNAVGEMLVLLAIEGDRLLGARLGSVATRVDRVVAAVLRDPSPRR